MQYEYFENFFVGRILQDLPPGSLILPIESLSAKIAPFFNPSSDIRDDPVLLVFFTGIRARTRKSRMVGLLV
ncbi:MAG: hypothetical protein GKR98_06650 [Boseongicola sp.]|nr:MAG: hypothetical protein GKR98_06650 [Boseongicola sp.]